MKNILEVGSGSNSVILNKDYLVEKLSNYFKQQENIFSHNQLNISDILTRLEKIYFGETINNIKIDEERYGLLLNRTINRFYKQKTILYQDYYMKDGLIDIEDLNDHFLNVLSGIFKIELITNMLKEDLNFDYNNDYIYEAYFGNDRKINFQKENFSFCMEDIANLENLTYLKSRIEENIPRPAVVTNPRPAVVTNPRPAVVTNPRPAVVTNPRPAVVTNPNMEGTNRKFIFQFLLSVTTGISFFIFLMFGPLHISRRLRNVPDEDRSNQQLTEDDITATAIARGIVLFVTSSSIIGAATFGIIEMFYKSIFRNRNSNRENNRAIIEQEMSRLSISNRLEREVVNSVAVSIEGNMQQYPENRVSEFVRFTNQVAQSGSDLDISSVSTQSNSSAIRLIESPINIRR